MGISMFSSSRKPTVPPCHGEGLSRRQFIKGAEQKFSLDKSIRSSVTAFGRCVHDGRGHQVAMKLSTDG